MLFSIFNLELLEQSNLKVCTELTTQYVYKPVNHTTYHQELPLPLSSDARYQKLCYSTEKDVKVLICINL